MERKNRVLTAVLIILAIIAIAIAALPFVAGRLFSSVNTAKNPAQAEENGDEMINEAKVVMAIGAHPDDLEYYTGGTLGVMADKGKTVIGVTAADMSFIQATRRAEGRKAASFLGYKPIFLGHRERDYQGGLTAKDLTDIRQELKDLIKKYKVDTVIAYDYADQGPVYHHIDHILTGKEAQAAAREAGVKHVYLYFSADPNTTIDISGVLTKKSEAMAAHVSQHTKWYMGPLRILFGWLQPTRSASSAGNQRPANSAATSTATSDDHNFGNTEAFRRL